MEGRRGIQAGSRREGAGAIETVEVVFYFRRRSLGNESEGGEVPSDAL